MLVLNRLVGESIVCGEMCVIELVDVPPPAATVEAEEDAAGAAGGSAETAATTADAATSESGQG